MYMCVYIYIYICVAPILGDVPGRRSRASGELAWAAAMRVCIDIYAYA